MKSKIKYLFALMTGVMLASCSYYGPTSNPTTTPTSQPDPTTSIVETTSPDPTTEITEVTSNPESTTSVDVPTVPDPSTSVEDPTTAPTPSTSIEDPTTPSTSEPAIPDYDVSTFANALKTAEPTEVFYESTSNFSNYGVTLNATSTFLIEYGDAIKGKYTYEYEKLNPLPADEFISKVRGTTYVKGDKVYNLASDNSLEECTAGQFNLQLVNVSLKESYLQDDFVIDTDKETLTANIKNNRVSSFFNGENIDISNCEITIKCKNGQLKSIDFSYDSAHGGNVDMLFEYDYDYVKVVLPNE